MIVFFRAHGVAAAASRHPHNGEPRKAARTHLLCGRAAAAVAAAEHRITHMLFCSVPWGPGEKLTIGKGGGERCLGLGAFCGTL